MSLARFNIQEGFWINGRRSQTRRQMSLANEAIEPLVQPSLFAPQLAPPDAVAFFVGCFSGSLSVSPHRPVSIQIAVPDRSMKGWLFKEPLHEFVQRYDAPVPAQEDLARPSLKKTSKQGLGGSGAA